MRKGTKIYLTASIVAQASALIRYIILARMLGPEELGLAAMLILTAQFFDSISDTGSDRFVVQDPEGGSPRVLSLVHLVMAGRGLLIALALVVTSGLVASIYRSPEIQPALMFLALVPLVGGLAHLDVRRAQREEDFRPESYTTIVSELVSAVVTAIAAYITRDHTAILYGLFLRQLTWILMSHITAKTPYRWKYTRQDAARFSAFAAPLFLNGLLLYFGSQGDRLIIGSGLGPEALGHYSAILLLVYYPASTVSKFIAGIHMPLLAAARGSPGRYEREEQKLAGRTVLLSLGMAGGFAVVGPLFTPLFYGDDFRQPLQIFALLGVLQAGRLLRVWPTTAAVSIGRSTVVLLNNLARTASLPVALIANMYFHSLEAIIAGFIVGEVAALIVALFLLAKDAPVSIVGDLTRVSVYLVGSAIILAWAWSLQFHWFVAVPVLLLATVGAAIFILKYEAQVIGDSIRLAQTYLGRLVRR